MIALAAFVAPVLAAQVHLEADLLELAVGQGVELRLTVVDGRRVGTPTLPAVDGLLIQPTGQHVSSVMVNFRSTRTVTFTYQVNALTPGEVVIPPVRVDVDGAQLTTEPLRLHVVPRGSQGGGPRITASFDDEDGNLWVGQTVVYRVQFRTAERLLDMRWTPPAFEGFLPDQTSAASEKQVPLQEGNQTWTLLDLAVPLVVTAAGTRTVGPGVVQTQVAVQRVGANGRPSRFTEARNDVFSTEAIPVKARELPGAGRSEAWSGLVGRFTVEAEASTREVELGDTFTVSVTIKGTGTLAGFALPPPPSDATWRVYDDQPEIEARVVDGRFVTVGRFRRAIVPEQAGTLDLGPLTLQTFDPGAGAFVDVVGDAIQVEVLPGDGAAAAQVDTFADVGGTDRRRDVAELGEDILPIHTGGRLRTQVPRLWPGPALLAGAPVAGWLGLISVLAWSRRPRREDPRRALRRRLEEAASGSPDAAVLEALLRDAAAGVLRVPAPSVDRAALERLPEPAREASLIAWKALETARYAGGKVDGLRETTLAAVRALLEVR